MLQKSLLLVSGLLMSTVLFASSCDGINVKISNGSDSPMRVELITPYKASTITLTAGETIGRRETKIVQIYSGPGTHGNAGGEIVLSSYADPSHKVTMNYKATQWFPWYCHVAVPEISGTSKSYFLAGQQFNNKDIEFDIWGS